MCDNGGIPNQYHGFYKNLVASTLKEIEEAAEDITIIDVELNIEF